MTAKKIRLDQFLVKNGLINSREKAKDAIQQKRVVVNNQVITKPSYVVSEKDKVLLEPEALSFVSRAGIKLHEAIAELGIQIENKICLDIGASTGGFSDCLLQRKAARVFCVDVGREQLAAKLRNDARVQYWENQHIKDFSKENLTDPVDLIVVDVSFISLTKITHLLTDFLPGTGAVLALIKPQFEVGAENIGKNGIVSNSRAVDLALKRIRENFTECGFRVNSIIKSKLSGKDGNQEYFIYAEL